MKYSIITINYNNKDGLEMTINSVLEQTYKDFEFIIIDGGSTDGSKELIEKYGKETSSIKDSDTGMLHRYAGIAAVAAGQSSELSL